MPDASPDSATQLPLAIALPALWIVSLGLVLSGALLCIAAFDVARALGGYGWLLMVGAAGVIGTAAVTLGALRQQLQVRPTWLTAAAIPIGLFGSILGCMGLDFSPCARACGILSFAVLPVLTICSAWLFLRPSWLLYLLATILGAQFLLPNCQCMNEVNARWIRLFGQSPACFSAGAFSAFSALAAMAMQRWRYVPISAAWIAIAFELCFFVGHHYLHFPW